MILWWSRGHDDHMIIIQVQHPISYCRLSITSIGFFTSIMDKTLNLTATSKPCVVLVWYLIINSWPMLIRNQMFPLSRVLNSTGIFRCHSKVELTNDLKGQLLWPWWKLPHGSTLTIPRIVGCLIIILNQQTFSQRLDGIGIVGEIFGCCFPDKTGYASMFSRHFFGPENMVSP